MKVLALETSGWSGSAAILSGGSVIAQAALPATTRTAIGLAPLVKSLLDEAGWKPESVDLVAVTSGPGSFTGLRVGVTTAKTFAYASKAEVMGVNTLEAIAFGCFAADEDVRNGRLSVVMDAQRKQLFAAEYSCVGDGDELALKTESECQIVDGEQWIASLGADASTRVAGPGLAMKLADGRTVIESLRELGHDKQVVAEEHWQLMASSVGRLAFGKYAAGTRDDLWKLAPQYFRLSAAEEKAAATPNAANEN